MKTAFSQEGVYYLFLIIVILIGSIMREVNLLLLFSAFLFAPLIIQYRLGRKSLTDLTVRRRLPSQIYAGEPFVVHLEMTNPRLKRWNSISSWGVVVVDRIRPIQFDENGKREDIKPFEPAVYFEYIPNRQTRRKTYAGRLPQRGRYEIGPMMISTRFPTGFLRHYFELPIEDGGKTEFCVYPKLGKLTANWRTRQHEAIESQQRHRFRPSRGSGEFLAVRRWEQGDVKKWIHWRASAKHNEPVVRQFEQNQNRDCAVLIDLYQPGKMNALRVENFELAVSFAATLVTEITRRGSSNLFFTTSEKHEDFLSGPVCMPLVENILSRLALVEPSREDVLAELLLHTLSHTDPSAELVLVCTEPLDLGASPRFDAVRHDPRFRSLFQRLRVIDTSSPDLDVIFSF